MLFVFGKRAKQLRHNKVSELIHSSEKHPNLTFARVSVYFQDIIDAEGENFRVVEGSQFVISRIGYKNNSSKYTLNDKEVKFSEIADLLKEKGINLDHNRFLILQVYLFLHHIIIVVILSYLSLIHLSSSPVCSMLYIREK